MKITLDSRTLRIDDLEGIDDFHNSISFDERANRGDPYVNDNEDLIEDNNDEGEV